MLRDITIGQYIARDSQVHKLDSRIKILISVLFMAAIFMIESLYQYLFIFIGLIFVIKLSNLPIKYIVKGVKPLRAIILLTFFLNIFMTEGDTIFSYWIFNVTSQGLERGIFMAVRLVLMVVGTSLLTLTTSPIELTDGLEYIFKPLSKIGFPAHELAMMMTIALRFIPTLIEESDKIMKAQMARGADFESGNILNRAKNMVPLLVPLFINSIRRASDLATAMEARCYRGGDQRTRLNELKMDKNDGFALIISLIYLILVIYLGKLLNFI